MSIKYDVEEDNRGCIFNVEFIYNVQEHRNRQTYSKTKKNDRP